MTAMEKVLHQLGISALKPKQKRVLRYILDHNRDVFALLPTGYGKSLCYTIPHLISGKNVIVISPLISLMKDQHDNLNTKGIKSVCFNSHNTTLGSDLFTQGDCEMVKQGKIRGLLYFSPERFLKSESLIKHLVEKDLVALVAVDEAHCVVGWSDFRSSYTSLHCIRDWIKPKLKKTKIPILALSASVAPKSLLDIATKLRLRRAKVVKAPFWKSNLALVFQPKACNLDGDLIMITDAVNKNKSGKSVLYCKTRKATEQIHQALVKRGFNALLYHGGLNSGEREIMQQDFKSKKNTVLVATIAFGMGIDIPDIYLVIHYGLSKDVESYYQEIGRAGRDGCQAKCITFYGKSDANINRRLASTISDPVLRQRQLDAGTELEKLVHTSSCRMKQLANYFGDETDKKCNQCDVCTNESQPSVCESKNNNLPCYNIVLRILETMGHIGYGCGHRTLAGILTGSKNKRINRHMQDSPHFGYYKKLTQNCLSEWVKQLQYANLLREHSSGAKGITYLKMSPQGHQWVAQNRVKVIWAEKVLMDFVSKLRETRTFQSKSDTFRKQVANSGNESNQNMIDKLKRWRHQRASQDSLPVYCILQNKVLEDIAAKMPRTEKDLLSIRGIGPKKVSQYATELFSLY
jgi:ATP-dependent DNA helicase RecQ